jgi:ankyrin repeat protein
MTLWIVQIVFFVIVVGLHNTNYTATATVGGQPAESNIFGMARAGDIDAVKSYLEGGTGPSSRDSKGNTPLIIAAGRGHADVINLLLEAGASYDEATASGIFEGKSALCWATSQGRVKAVVTLLQAGANPNFVQQVGVFAGKTPLMWAASQGKNEVLRLLISAGAEVDFASQSGNFMGKSGLMWASSQGRVDAVNTLLEHGADVNAVDSDRMSALMWAAGSEARDKSHMRGMLEKPSKGSREVVQLLLRYGAMVDMRDKDGITSLMYACYHGHASAVSALLNAGADADFLNKAGRTALHLALNSGFSEAAAAIRRGPTIITDLQMDIDSLVQVPTCGWVLSVLRAPRGTGVYPLKEPSTYHQATVVAAHQHTDYPTLGNSCGKLHANGLAHHLGDLLYIVHTSSVAEVVSHLGLGDNFAAVQRARDQLARMYKRWEQAVAGQELFEGSSGSNSNAKMGELEIDATSP